MDFRDFEEGEGGSTTFQLMVLFIEGAFWLAPSLLILRYLGQPSSRRFFRSLSA